MSGYEHKLRRLLDVGRALVGELDPEAVLHRILEEARDLTGARYAALGVLDETRLELERFLTVGIDTPAHRAIGDLPHGRGVLGVLIDDPQPLRLANVGEHPHSYGFPAAHPAMQLSRRTDRHPGPGLGQFVSDREGGRRGVHRGGRGGGHRPLPSGQRPRSATHACTRTASRREQLERAVRSLEAARDITDAITSASDLERILELIVKRGRALVDARTVLILLREGDELVVAASAGHARGARGHRIPVPGSTAGQVLERGRAERIVDVDSRLKVVPEELGVRGARTGLLVPLLRRGAGLGVLAAFDRGPEREPFDQEDEQLLRTFAAAAANAVALSRSVEADRLRSTIAAAEAERKRWARELHDQTLQSLGGLRVSLASILGRLDAAAKNEQIRQAIEDIETEIGNLRGIISDLRPSLLDDLGLSPRSRRCSIGAARTGSRSPASWRSPIRSPGAWRSIPELEITVYRVVQEALTNITKHARADSARVSLTRSDGQLLIEVSDDGVGFDPATPTGGFGLAGMRERVYLAGGTCAILPSELGTLVRVQLPVRTSIEQPSLSAADQMAT
jgi:signal transduction histidine kinase